MKPIQPIQPLVTNGGQQSIQTAPPPEDDTAQLAEQAKAQQASEEQQQALEDTKAEKARLDLENQALKHELHLNAKEKELIQLQGQSSEGKTPEAPAGPHPAEEENAKLRNQVALHKEEMRVQKLKLETEAAQQTAQTAAAAPAAPAVPAAPSLHPTLEAQAKRVQGLVAKVVNNIKAAGQQPGNAPVPPPAAPAPSAPPTAPAPAVTPVPKPTQPAIVPGQGPPPFAGATPEYRQARLAALQKQISQFKTPTVWDTFKGGVRDYINDPDAARATFGQGSTGTAMNWVDHNVFKPFVRHTYMAGADAAHGNYSGAAGHTVGAVATNPFFGGVASKALRMTPVVGGVVNSMLPDSEWNVHSKQFKVGDQYVSPEDELRKVAPAAPQSETPTVPAGDKYDGQRWQTAGYYHPEALAAGPYADRTQFQNPVTQQLVNTLSPLLMPQVNYSRFQSGPFSTHPETMMERLYALPANSGFSTTGTL